MPQVPGYQIHRYKRQNVRRLDSRQPPLEVAPEIRRRGALQCVAGKGERHDKPAENEKYLHSEPALAHQMQKQSVMLGPARRIRSACDVDVDGRMKNENAKDSQKPDAI